LSSRQKDFSERQRVVWKLSSPTGLHSEGPAHAEGTTGQIHPRNGMSLVTVAHCSVVDTGECDARIARKQALVPILSEPRRTRVQRDTSRVAVHREGPAKTPRDPVFLQPPRRGCFQYMESQSSQIRGGAGIVTLERTPGVVSSTRAFYSPSRSSFCDLFACQTAPIGTTAKAVRTVLRVLNPAVIAPICNPCQHEV